MRLLRRTRGPMTCAEVGSPPPGLPRRRPRRRPRRAARRAPRDVPRLRHGGRDLPRHQSCACDPRHRPAPRRRAGRGSPTSPAGSPTSTGDADPRSAGGLSPILGNRADGPPGSRDVRRSTRVHLAGLVAGGLLVLSACGSSTAPAAAPYRRPRPPPRRPQSPAGDDARTDPAPSCDAPVPPRPPPPPPRRRRLALAEPAAEGHGPQRRHGRCRRLAGLLPADKPLLVWFWAPH